ncbi:unnamed protein product [Notodromas monacha]|uniref:Lethal giant larvae homologue 2 domain-containing protein n=1 Tax=Notodromas monacha TaxID=399045 RepID=A0A7R9BKQ3_9CRUS|nr:unnamed protein product [Notodromas monacha]CAG0915956.1 unnamed protein product [Notodromas monacha]
MKKFTFKGVLDGFTNKGGDGQVAPKPPKNEVEETLKSLHFRACKTVRHGFPFEPTTLAHDPVQKLIAIGNKKGHIRILGQPGVDIHLETPSRVPVIQLAFMINNGGLVAAMADDTLVLWNLRQKNPEIVNSVGFQRERLTCVNLPPTSRFAYVGTDRGNVYVVNVSTFDLSGYVVNWNKAIEVTQKRHPGCVVHLSENPLDNSKLLICYENGSMVVWDLPKKTGEVRFTWPDAQLRSASWFSDGKQFMCSHVDGSLTTWSLRQPQRPISHVFPHGKQGPEGKQEPCEPIFKLEWKSSRGLEVRDALVIFSGGLPSESKSPSKNLTLINGKNTTVLEMEHPIIDFVAISDKPWSSDSQDPFAVAVLLTEDLVVLDLTVTGYPCFENPYPMDIHESPVTSCLYLVNCPGELIGTFYQVGKRNSKRGQFSPNSWPIDGGVPGTPTTSYSEIVVTGHADGSVKFWDASGSSLQVLYKLKTGKIFDRPKAIATEDPFAVSKMSWCPEGRFLAVAGASPHVLLFTFHKHEVTSHVPCLEIPIVYEVCDDEDTATTGFDFVPRGDKSPTFGEKKKSLEYSVPLTVRSGLIRKAPGFQIQFVCLTPTVEGRRPGPITALKLNSAYNLPWWVVILSLSFYRSLRLAYGNESGLVIVDMLQRTCLLNMGTPDLYGTADPYQRAARSPKKIDREKEDNADSQNKDGVATDPGSALNPGVKENGCPPVAPPRRKKRFQLPQLRHHNNKDDDSEDLNDEEDGNLLALVRSSARSMSLPVNAESFEMVAVDATGVPLVQPTTSSSKAKAATTTRKLLARFRSADDDQAIYDEEEEAEEEQTRSWRKVKCAHDGGGGDDDENEDDDVGEGMTDVCSDLLLRALAVRRRTIVAEQRRERHHGMLSGLRTRLRPGGGAAGAAAPLVGHVMMGEDVDRVHVSDLRRCGRRDAPVLIHADDGKADIYVPWKDSSLTSEIRGNFN